MDPRSAPEPSSFSHHSALNPRYNEQDYSASLLHAESLSGHIQSSELEESQIIGGSSLHPSHLPLLYGLSDTRTNLPFLTDPNAPDTFHAASMQYAYPIDWRGLNQQIGQGEIENHNLSTSRQDIYGVSGPPSPPDPSSPTITVEDATSSPVATPGQSATTQNEKKKEKDMLRKRAQRLEDRQHFARICKLLKIPSSPRTTLVRRILAAVEELVERCKLESERQCRLEENEAGAAVLTEELAQLPTEGDASFPPINVHTFMGASDTGATRAHGSGQIGL